MIHLMAADILLSSERLLEQSLVSSARLLPWSNAQKFGVCPLCEHDSEMLGTEDGNVNGDVTGGGRDGADVAIAVRAHAPTPGPTGFGMAFDDDRPPCCVTHLCHSTYQYLDYGGPFRGKRTWLAGFFSRDFFGHVQMQ